MKADRYLHPDRHLEQDMDNNPTQPDEEAFAADPQNAEANNGSGANPFMEVDVGNAMPPTQAAHMPMLHPQVQSVMPNESGDGGQARSMLAEGLHFVGHVAVTHRCRFKAFAQPSHRHAATQDGRKLCQHAAQAAHGRADDDQILLGQPRAERG